MPDNNTRSGGYSVQGDSTAVATPTALFSLKPGQRPAGSIYDRISGTTVLADALASQSFAPRWHLVDNASAFFCVLGDSISVGYNANGVEDSFIEKTYRQLGNPAWHYANIAQSSARLSSASAPFDIDGLRKTYVSPVFNKMLGIFVVFGGTNDIKLDAQTGATCVTRTKTITDGLRASHPNAKIIVVSPLPRQNDASFETNRQAMRTSFNAGYTSWDYIADWGGNATMALNAASSTNATYYQDTTHPTDAGAIIGAGILLTQVNLARTALGI